MTPCTNTDFFYGLWQNWKTNAPPCDGFVFNLESKSSQTSAVVIAAADNVMWCFTQASSDEAAGVTVWEWWRRPVPGWQTGSLPLRRGSLLPRTGPTPLHRRQRRRTHTLGRSEEVKPLSKRNSSSCLVQGHVELPNPVCKNRVGLGGLWPVILSSLFCFCKGVSTIAWVHWPGCTVLPTWGPVQLYNKIYSSLIFFKY